MAYASCTSTSGSLPSDETPDIGPLSGTPGAFRLDLRALSLAPPAPPPPAAAGAGAAGAGRRGLVAFVEAGVDPGGSRRKIRPAVSRIFCRVSSRRFRSVSRSSSSESASSLDHQDSTESSPLDEPSSSVLPAEAADAAEVTEETVPDRRRDTAGIAAAGRGVGAGRS